MRNHEHWTEQVRWAAEIARAALGLYKLGHIGLDIQFFDPDPDAWDVMGSAQLDVRVIPCVHWIGRIKLYRYWWNQLSLDERYHLVVHEVAHLIADAHAKMNGRGPVQHGPTWRAVMRQLGENPDRELVGKLVRERGRA